MTYFHINLDPRGKEKRKKHVFSANSYTCDYYGDFLFGFFFVSLLFFFFWSGLFKGTCSPPLREKPPGLGFRPAGAPLLGGVGVGFHLLLIVYRLGFFFLSGSSKTIFQAWTQEIPLEIKPPPP